MARACVRVCGGGGGGVEVVVWWWGGDSRVWWSLGMARHGQQQPAVLSDEQSMSQVNRCHLPNECPTGAGNRPQKHRQCRSARTLTPQVVRPKLLHGCEGKLQEISTTDSPIAARADSGSKSEHDHSNEKDNSRRVRISGVIFQRRHLGAHDGDRSHQTRERTPQIACG
jgi:hypothetical protein